MARKQETVFKQRIAPKLHALPNSWWVKVQQVAVRGTPDILGCINGYFIALELKRDEKAPVAKLQAWTHEKILASRGVMLVVYPENWDETFTYLQRIANGEKP